MEQATLEILALTEKLKLVPELTSKVTALQQVYLTCPELRALTERVILHLAERYKNAFLLSYPDPGLSQGDYPIGMVHCVSDRYSFGLHKQELLRHMGIYAMTGGGKSVALDAVLYHLLRDHVPCIIFDWDGSHRHFLSRPEGSSLNFFSPGSKDFPLPFNPNKVSGNFSVQQQFS